MESNEIQVPASPAELFAMQRVGKVELEEGNPHALSNYLDGELFPELDPSMTQVLVAAKAMLERLEGFHYDFIEENQGTMSDYTARIWKRDAKNVSKALMALRQVQEG
jgi:hypothetical protein